MGRKVSAIVVSLLFLGSILAGCSGEKPEEVANTGDAKSGKGGMQEAKGTPPAGPNPNLTPEQIDNRAGSALGNK